MIKLIFIGAGGHAKSVADSLDETKIELCGFIDENKTGTHYGKPILGSRITDIPEYEKYHYFVAIGNVHVRKKWFDEIMEMGLKTINIIDPTAMISSTAKIGIGNFIGKLAIVNADAVIGNNNIINTKALIEHECIVGNHVHLSTNSTINGNVIVYDEVFLGSSAVCNELVKIGQGAIIGSGSVVIKDVKQDTTVVGAPARAVRG